MKSCRLHAHALLRTTVIFDHGPSQVSLFPPWNMLAGTFQKTWVPAPAPRNRADGGGPRRLPAGGGAEPPQCQATYSARKGSTTGTLDTCSTGRLVSTLKLGVCLVCSCLAPVHCFVLASVVAAKPQNAAPGKG